MGNLPTYGKIKTEFFDRVIYPNLGSKSNLVLVGPSPGVDTCVVKVRKDTVLVATTDPMSYIPEIGVKDSAFESVNLVASDIATSGFPPRYALFDFNLPRSMNGSVFERYWRAVSKECKTLGITVVGGHTGRFDALDSTVVGACTMFSTGPSGEFLTSMGGRIGDKVIVTKSAAIAATAILARTFPKKIGAVIGRESLERAMGLIRKTTVVKDALIAARSGANAIHDSTEGVVVSAMYELAKASKKGLQLNLSKIPVLEETKEICEIFKIDPFTSLSEGALVISCTPSKVNNVVSALRSARIEATIVGELVRRKDGIKTVKHGRKVSIKYPPIDPYWRAYYEGRKRRWG